MSKSGWFNLTDIRPEFSELVEWTTSTWLYFEPCPFIVRARMQDMGEFLHPELIYWRLIYCRYRRIKSSDEVILVKAAAHEERVHSSR